MRNIVSNLLPSRSPQSASSSAQPSPSSSKVISSSSFSFLGVGSATKTPCKDKTAYYDMAVMFWRIINNCEPQELLMDLLLQGNHNKRQKKFHLQQSNMERVGKFSFANRLNDIIPLLSDSWLDESEKQMKKTLKTKILEIVPAKCDS
jgi:hypothetical protein